MVFSAISAVSPFHVVTRNGFVRRSLPIVVLGPWPEYTTASSPNAKSTVRIERRSVA